ncbi:MAG: hypothetical protein IKU07_01365 [Oscillospiraceae bacterium]|nr:hypothetical protein [Oscillospiraceae bacterium]
MKRGLAAALLAGILLSGCGGAPEAPVTTEPTEQSAHQELTAESATFNPKTDMRIDLPQLGLENVLVRDCVSNVSVEEAVSGDVYLLADDGAGSRRDGHYLLVAAEETVTAVDLWKIGETDCVTGEIAVADVDGDTDKEIIVQEAVDFFGGAGQYRSWVFDYKDGKLQELFCSVKNGDLTDTGFSVKLLENRQFEIQNSITGYREIFTVTNKQDLYFEGWYNKDGTVIDRDLWVDSFLGFKPVDVDGDGVWELECTQYTSLFSHADFFGWAHSVMRYNAETRSFQIINAWFVVE